MRRKVEFLPCLCFFALLLLLAVCIFNVSPQNYALASTSDEKGAYDFYFKNYDVTYDVKKNREIDVTEVLTVDYTGYANTGFIQYIPVNGGEQVKNVKVTENSKSVPFTVYSESVYGVTFLCLDIGSSSLKADQTHTYTIKYKYCLTRAQEGKNILYLNAIGVDRPAYCHIEKATVKFILPNGYLRGKCTYGSLLSEKELPLITKSETEIEVTPTALKYNEGITVRLEFEDGVLSTYSEFTPYWFAVAGGAILVILLFLKLVVFKDRKIIPVVNFEAPNGTDPLMIGKLVDNKVNSEDITSMIYYWADKKYIKINFDDKDDPVLIRVMKSLPDSCPDYEKIMYRGIFAGGEAVKISSLEGKFYATAQKVTSIVNSQTKGLFTSTSISLSLIFALLGGLLLGLAPFILGSQIASNYLLIIPFISLLPALVVYGLSESVKYSSLKISKKKTVLYCGGIALLCAALCGIYIVAVPSYVIDYLPKAVISIVSALIVCLSVSLITKSEKYTKELGDIIGFKNFITLAEKDQLEKMIEDDPQYYYHILPYAQVLGVSDIWEQKFEGITVEPPSWATGSGDLLGSMIEFHIINSILRASMLKMAAKMITAPSSRGGSGRGGFGGGHVGGGHGGGGFRGR
ncbi:MAG: DUF2207 domain-containing protein [Clostridiales bacterium]|nr:DUF2207 domain-containing protein [Clostridiales bacterium]